MLSFSRASASRACLQFRLHHLAYTRFAEFRASSVLRLEESVESAPVTMNRCNGRAAARARYAPVSECGLSTSFDSGEPSCRRKMDSTIIERMARNSLCQFWNDSNQNCDVLR